MAGFTTALTLGLVGGMFASKIMDRKRAGAQDNGGQMTPEGATQNAAPPATAPAPQAPAPPASNRGEGIRAASAASRKARRRSSASAGAAGVAGVKLGTPGLGNNAVLQPKTLLGY